MLEITNDSLQLAAQAWCKPETSHIQMDPILAQAFAEILDQQGHKIVALKLKLSASEKARKDAEKRFYNSLKFINARQQPGIDNFTLEDFDQ